MYTIINIHYFSTRKAMNSVAKKTLKNVWHIRPSL